MKSPLLLDILLTLAALAFLLAAPDASRAQPSGEKLPEARLRVKINPQPAKPKPGNQPNFLEKKPSRPDRASDKPRFGYPKNDYNYNNNNYNNNYRPGWRPPSGQRPDNYRPGGGNRPGGPNHNRRPGYNYGYGYYGPAYYRHEISEPRTPPPPAEPPTYFGPGSFEPFDDPRFPAK